MQCFVSFLVCNHLEWEKELVALLCLSPWCLLSVIVLFGGAVGWSAVCDCVIS